MGKNEELVVLKFRVVPTRSACYFLYRVGLFTESASVRGALSLQEPREMPQAEWEHVLHRARLARGLVLCPPHAKREATFLSGYKHKEECVTQASGPQS